MLTSPTLKRMSNMRRCLPLLACAVLFWSAGLRAETFEEGLRAFRAGQPERALSIWQPLAEDGHAAAQYSIGKLFEQGEGPIKQDFGRAVRWYEAAAKQDLPAAQNNLGLMYAKGRGVPQNVDRAMDLWFAAARQDYPWSQYNLGLAYFQGRGVDADQQEALAWFRRAADGGLADAQFIMGQLYREGLIVDQDQGRALTWYLRAADQGHMRAKKQVSHLQNAQVSPKPTGDPEALPKALAEEPAPEPVVAAAEPKEQPATAEPATVAVAVKPPLPPSREKAAAARAQIAEQAPMMAAPAVTAEKAPVPAPAPAPRLSATPEPLITTPEKPKIETATPRLSSAGQVASLRPEGVMNDAKDGSYRVWLASASSEAEAVKLWQSTRTEHPDLFSATEADFSAVDIGGGKTLYRILAGPLASSAAALRLCQRLREARPDAFCQVRSQ
ncbi:MAG: SPOR domain-containing protein [Kiloniellales bacterium]|nr:SPOR domain-containing protein [Kiloniellales bacterium]